MWAVHEDRIPQDMTVAAYLRRHTDFTEAIQAMADPRLEQTVTIRDVPGVHVPGDLEQSFAAAFDRFDSRIWASEASNASPGVFRNLSLAWSGRPVTPMDPYTAQNHQRYSGADYLSFVHRSEVGSFMSIGTLLDQFTLTVGAGRLTVLVPPHPKGVPLVYPHRDASIFEELRLDICLSASPGLALDVQGAGDVTFTSGQCMWLNCSGYEHTLVNRQGWLGSRCSVHFSVWPWIEFDHGSRTYRPNQFFGRKHPIAMILDGDLTR